MPLASPYSVLVMHRARLPFSPELAVTASALAVLVSCAESPAEPLTVGSVVVAPATQTLASGGSTTLQATVLDAKGRPLDGRIVTWSASDQALATITGPGQITAGQNRGGATAPVTITASSEGRSGTATLNVTPVPTARVVVSPDSIALRPGGTASLAAVVQDAGGAALTGRQVTWTSSDATVVTVTDDGRLSAPVYSGALTRTARIIATVDGVRDTTETAVAPLVVARVLLSRDSVVLVPGDTAQLDAVLQDAASTVLTGRPLTWTSSDTAVATVNGTGVVRAQPFTGPATRVAQVIVASGALRDTTRIVVQPSPVASLQLASDTLSLVAGRVQLLSVSVLDARGTPLTGRVATWESLDGSVATVTSSGLLSAVSYAGALRRSTDVVVRVGGLAKTLRVIVEPVPVGRIDVTPASAAVRRGLEQELQAAVRDSSGTLVLTGRDLTWASSDEQVVRVTSAGLVFGMAAGSAFVTARAGGVSDSVQIVVYDVPSTAVDRDGNSYVTVQIGPLLWFASNLKTTRYRDGTPISSPLTGEQWGADRLGARTIYNQDIANFNAFGGLYNWHAVNTGRLCPVGWRVPTMDDWAAVASTLGGPAVAGGKMKSVSDLWWAPNTGATNESGFNGLPGSMVNENLDVQGGFGYLGWGGWWWSSSRVAGGASYVGLIFAEERLSTGTGLLNWGFSVRCVFDPEQLLPTP